MRAGESPAERHSQQVNIGNSERIISGLSGGALTLYGLKCGGLKGFSMMLMGGGLIYWGVTGHCDVYSALGINTAKHRHPRASVQHGEGIKIEKSVIINKRPDEIFKFWRNFENLPRFMNHLDSVRIIDDKRSHWVAKAPAGSTVEWDAEIINESPNELIAWRSIEGAEIANAGSVRFEKTPNDRGTEVKVTLSYSPPGGKLGALIARIFGEEPERQVEEDLYRLKQVVESGEALSIDRRTSGQSAISGRR